MECGTLLLTCFFVALSILFAKWLLFILLAILCIMTASAEHQCKMLAQAKPTPMQCSNCGSKNVKIKAIVTGYTNAGGGASNGGIASWQGSSAIQRKRVYECQDCGFSDNYITSTDIQETVQNSKAKATGLTILTVIVLILSVIIMVAS